MEPQLFRAAHEVCVALDVILALPLLVCPERFEKLLRRCEVVAYIKSESPALYKYLLCHYGTTNESLL